MTSTLLKHAVKLVPKHGFTRQTLSLAALELPTPHSEPLPDSAVTALFGAGNAASKTLIQAWLDEGRTAMREAAAAHEHPVQLKDLLVARLKYNEAALPHLPDAFKLLMAPSGLLPVPDPRAAIAHAASVADDACQLARDPSLGTSWYTRRAAVSIVYAAAELHQLTGPPGSGSAAGEDYDALVGRLLATSDTASGAVSNTAQFGEYMVRSWAGIARSRGLL